MDLSAFCQISYLIEAASDSDFSDVIDLLGPSELDRLFYALDIRTQDRDRAKVNAGVLPDAYLMAKNVLEFWRMKNGHAACRDVIVDALMKCKYYKAIKELQTKWNLEGEDFCSFLAKISCRQNA